MRKFKGITKIGDNFVENQCGLQYVLAGWESWSIFPALAVTNKTCSDCHLVFTTAFSICICNPICCRFDWEEEERLKQCIRLSVQWFKHSEFFLNKSLRIPWCSKEPTKQRYSGTFSKYSSDLKCIFAHCFGNLINNVKY